MLLDTGFIPLNSSILVYMVNVVFINPLPHHILFIMPGTRLAPDRTTPILITTEMASQMQDLERSAELIMIGESKWTGKLPWPT
jgi:hypothetical protein